ncbi:MAG: GC-type dockerin domain-anchored protein [Planctomycetota bacterium]
MNTMQRLTIAAGLLCASTAMSQNLAISFQPTGEPNTYDMVAELYDLAPHYDFWRFDRVRSVWAGTAVRFTGDAPITILEWNPAYESALGGPTLIDNGSPDTKFVAIQNEFFGFTDASNPLLTLRFHYAGTLEAFAAEMIDTTPDLFAQNYLLAEPTCGHCFNAVPYRPMFNADDDLLTYSFGPLPGVECTADINGDGALSPGDFNAWILAFNNHSIGCDQNGDGACTAGDFNAWILNYNAGC